MEDLLKIPRFQVHNAEEVLKQGGVQPYLKNQHVFKNTQPAAKLSKEELVFTEEENNAIDELLYGKFI